MKRSMAQKMSRIKTFSFQKYQNCHFENALDEKLILVLLTHFESWLPLEQGSPMISHLSWSTYRNNRNMNKARQCRSCACKYLATIHPTEPQPTPLNHTPHYWIYFLMAQLLKLPPLLLISLCSVLRIMKKQRQCHKCWQPSLCKTLCFLCVWKWQPSTASLLTFDEDVWCKHTVDSMPWAQTGFHMNIPFAVVQISLWGGRQT
jgi:hypothetical protein